MATIFLKKDDLITLGEANLTVLGSALGSETVSLLNSARAKINSHVDIVQLAGQVSDYKFSVEGSLVNVYLNNDKVAAISAQEDTDGTQIKFSDTQASLKLTGLGVATLGMANLTTTATSYTKAQLASPASPISTPTDIWKSYSSGFTGFAVSDNNVFLTQLYQSDRKLDVLVNKLNSDLSIAKTVFVGDSSAQGQNSICATADGGLVITGSQSVDGIISYGSYITKLDKNLAVVGTVIVGSEGEPDQVNAVASRSDGKIVAVGYDRSVSDPHRSDAYILLLNSDMSVAAQKSVSDANNPSSYNSFTSLTVLQDNSILANAGYGVIVQFDKDLNMVRTVDFNIPFSKFVQTDNGNLYAYSGYHLFQLDSDLTITHKWYLNWDFNNSEISYMIAQGNNLIIKNIFSSLIQVDVSGTQPLITQEEYIVTRSGGYVYTDDFAILNDTVLLATKGGGIGGGILYSVKPSIDITPNYESDYRVNEGDISNNTILERALDISTRQTPLNYTATDINIIGNLSFTTLDATGVTTISAGASLIA